MPAMTKAASLQPADTGADCAPSSMLGDYIPAILLALSGVTGLAFAGVTMRPDTNQYLVIAPPGSSLAETINIVRSAGGGLIQKGRLPNIVIAGSARTDFAHAVRQTGGWLAIAAPARGGCGFPSPQEQGL